MNIKAMAILGSLLLLVIVGCVDDPDYYAAHFPTAHAAEECLMEGKSQEACTERVINVCLRTYARKDGAKASGICERKAAEDLDVAATVIGPAERR